MGMKVLSWGHGYGGFVGAAQAEGLKGGYFAAPPAPETAEMRPAEGIQLQVSANCLEQSPLEPVP